MGGRPQAPPGPTCPFDPVPPLRTMTYYDQVKERRCRQGAYELPRIAVVLGSAWATSRSPRRRRLDAL
jgi:hypothetical protein